MAISEQTSWSYLNSGCSRLNEDSLLLANNVAQDLEERPQCMMGGYTCADDQRPHLPGRMRCSLHVEMSIPQPDTRDNENQSQAIPRRPGSPEALNLTGAAVLLLLDG